MKCPACKFDNSKREFELRRNNTTFSALDHQFTQLSKQFNNIEEFVRTLCPVHLENGAQWFDSVSDYYKKLKNGVYLPIRRNIP